MPAEGGGLAELSAVLFDMDGLLVNTEEHWYAAELAVAADLGAPWGPEQQAALVGGPLHEMGQLLRDLSGSDRSRESIVSQALDEMDKAMAVRPVELMPGARDLLVELTGDGVPCALVSASYRRLVDAVLRSIGQDEHGWFATTVAGDEVTRTKPDPEPYLTAAARLGVEPTACVVLEDSPTGAAAGQAAGCFVVAVPSLRPIDPGPRRVVVPSLEDVDLAYLRKLLA